ncbi:MAG: sigma-54-dependent Fis family transcriptional regulator [Deltaproteobacteria bacterium]|nr:sigma-54-dependent Fis family transcriptional regulator [Deltaproteobacteria bacterium]
MKSILVVSKEQEIYKIIRSCYRSSYRVDQIYAKDSALLILQRKRYDYLFIDIEILKQGETNDGLRNALQTFWRVFPSLEIVVMSPQGMIREAVIALKAGASNYLTYPLNPEEVKYVTETIDESIIMQSELNYLRDKFWQADSLEIVQTKSRAMTAVFEKIRSVAPTKSTVLLAGETGTGKGVMASLIHKHSNRRDSQFISVHCGAIPDTLLESELFGHEKGAFTGAVRRKLGKFEIARGGTIFLDEIGTITASAQIKLLQILQDGSFNRVGGEETIEANVRVIAATNMNLKEMCDAGLFRKDLYYRLNVFPIEISPLRDRKDDIPHFVEVFLRRMNKFNSKEIYHVHPSVLESFQRYSWPGNIRELENLIERAYILETTSVLRPESFPSELFETPGLASNEASDTSLSLAEARRLGLEGIERNYIKGQLLKNRGKIKDTAKASGITTRQLHKLMKKHNIRKEDFKSAA